MIANDTEGCCTLLIDVKFMENTLRGRGGGKAKEMFHLLIMKQMANKRPLILARSEIHKLLRRYRHTRKLSVTADLRT